MRVADGASRVPQKPPADALVVIEVKTSERLDNRAWRVVVQTDGAGFLVFRESDHIISCQAPLWQVINCWLLFFF